MKVLKKYIFIFVLSVFALQLSAQEVVFRYYTKTDDRIIPSNNGLYLAVYSEPWLYIVENTSGNIIGKTSLNTENSELITFAISNAGKNLAVLIYSYSGDETNLNMYELTYVNQLELKSETGLNITSEVFDHQMLLNWKNDEYIEISNKLVYSNNAFGLLDVYRVYDGYIYSLFSLGDLSNNNIGYSFLDGFRNESFAGFEISDDYKYITVMSSIQPAEKNWKHNMDGTEFHYFVMDWELTGGKRKYYSLFPDMFSYYNENTDSSLVFINEMEKCLTEKEEQFYNSYDPDTLGPEFYEIKKREWTVDCRTNARRIATEKHIQQVDFDFSYGESMHALHYDPEKQMVYGMANQYTIKTILQDTLNFIVNNNPFLKNNAALFPLTNVSNNQNPFRDKGMQSFPFAYNMKKGKFEVFTSCYPDMVLPVSNSIVQDSFANKSDWLRALEIEGNYLGSTADVYFSKKTNNLYLYTYYPLSNKYVILRIDTHTGLMSKLFLDHQKFIPQFTADDFLLLTLKDPSGYQIKIIDLEKWQVTKQMNYPSLNTVSFASDVMLTNIKNERHLFVQLADGIVDFNLSGNPFYKKVLYTDTISMNSLLGDSLRIASMSDSITNYYYSWGDTPNGLKNQDFYPDEKFIPHHTVKTAHGDAAWYAIGIEKEYYGWKYYWHGEQSSGSFDNVVALLHADELFDQGNKRSVSDYIHSVNIFDWHEPSQKLFTVSGNLIQKWNKENFKGEFVYHAHDDVIYAFDVMKNDSLMTAVSSDGKITIWNIYTNQHLADLFLFNEGKDWIFLTNENYYYGTKNATKNISFAFNRTALPVEYFELKYNRPDKILGILGSKNSSVISAYEKAFQRRLEKLNLNEEMLMIDFSVPVVEIKNLNKIPAVTDNHSIELDIDLHDAASPLHHLNIYNNGVAIYGTSGKLLMPNKHLRTEVSVLLADGTNFLEISVTNEKGAESYRRTLEIYKNHTGSVPVKYIIAIGADQYEQGNYNLQYAAKDAGDIIIALKNENEAETRTLLITGKNVNKEILREMREFLSPVTINDEIIIYYAGHGILDDQMNYYLGTYSTDFNRPSISGLPYDSLENVLDGVASLKKLLILDACHSGEFEKEDFVATYNPVIKKEKINFRSVGTQLTRNQKESLTSILREAFNEMRKGNGATVINSSSGGEFAIEGDEWNNGVFTWTFIQAVTNKKADVDGDGYILLSELKNYLQTTVPMLTNGAQTPSSRIENEKVDFIIR